MRANWMWHGMRAGVLMLSLTLAGCVSLPDASCPGGLRPADIARLYFGRSIAAGGSVSDAAWRDFVDREVAPRFPDGFTVADGAGAWRNATGDTIRERSKVLTIVIADAKGEHAKLDAIRAAYKTRFHQESVLLTEMKGCISF